MLSILHYINLEAVLLCTFSLKKIGKNFYSVILQERKSTNTKPCSDMLLIHILNLKEYMLHEMYWA